MITSPAHYPYELPTSNSQSPAIRLPNTLGSWFVRGHDGVKDANHTGVNGTARGTTNDSGYFFYQSPPHRLSVAQRPLLFLEVLRTSPTAALQHSSISPPGMLLLDLLSPSCEYESLARASPDFPDDSSHPEVNRAPGVLLLDLL